MARPPTVRSSSLMNNVLYPIMSIERKHTQYGEALIVHLIKPDEKEIGKFFPKSNVTAIISNGETLNKLTMSVRESSIFLKKKVDANIVFEEKW